ncbi:hypothetical protein D3C72_2146330 [compost metagenome]
MAQAGLLPAARAGAVDTLFHPGHRPNGGAGAVVPVQRLDVGHPVLRLPVR